MTDKLEPKYFGMDPKTDDLILSCKLANGMVVLRENSALRVEPKDMTIPRVADAGFKFNRWCTVTSIMANGNNITFIGVYDDGMKRQHDSDARSAWYVKLDSIKKIVEDEESEKARQKDLLDKVTMRVRSSMAGANNISREWEADEYNDYVKETAQKIMELFDK